jgi:hypothetical protein
MAPAAGSHSQIHASQLGESRPPVGMLMCPPPIRAVGKGQ